MNWIMFGIVCFIVIVLFKAASATFQQEMGYHTAAISRVAKANQSMAQALRELPDWPPKEKK